jgi:hypothetical protein
MKMLRPLLAVFMFAAGACGYRHQVAPDAGTPCPCSDLGDEWAEDEGRGRAIVSCLPVGYCSPMRLGGCPDAGSSVCLGEGCCVWTAGSS